MDGNPPPHDAPLTANESGVAAAILGTVQTAWIASPAVLAAGAVAAVVLLRRIADAASELASSQRRFRRVEDAMIPLRVETRRARTSLDDFDRR